MKPSSSPTPTTSPVDQLDNPIIWDGCLASGEGTMAAVGDWAITPAFLQSFFELRAVSSSSRTVTDHPDNIPFITGMIQPDEPYDFHNPAPPTPAKLGAYNAARSGSTPARSEYTRPSSGYPESILRDFSFQPLRIKEADARYFRMHKRVFGGSERSIVPMRSAKGSGTEFRRLLEAEFAKAKPSERALVAGKFNAIVTIDTDHLVPRGGV